MVEERGVFVESWCMMVTGPSIAASGLGGDGYLGSLGMVQVGYVEAARRAAQRDFLPGSEGGGFGQNNVAPLNVPARRSTSRRGRRRRPWRRSSSARTFAPLDAPRPLAVEAASLARPLRKRIFVDSCVGADAE